MSMEAVWNGREMSAEAAFTNSAAMNAAMIGSALHKNPKSNPMLRAWGCEVNGVRSQMPHDAHYIEFEGEFSEQTRKLFVEAIKYCHRSPSTPVIMIRINSYGGNIYSLLPMLDAIEAVRLTDKNPGGKPIYTLCSSHVMSCGAVLFSAGDVRIFNGDMAEMMVHPARVWVEGSQTNPALRSKAAQMDTLNNDLFAYMSKQFGIDMDRWLREKGNNYELHIRPDVAADPAAHWGEGADFWLSGSSKAPMAIKSSTDGVPFLSVTMNVSANLNVSFPEDKAGQEASAPALASAATRMRVVEKGAPVGLTIPAATCSPMEEHCVASMISGISTVQLSWDPSIV